MPGTYQTRCPASLRSATTQPTATRRRSTTGTSCQSPTPPSCSSASAASARTFKACASLTVNGLDAIAALGDRAGGRVVWDMDWLRFDASGGKVRKLSVTDTGTGMTPEQLRQYINQLASSGREQSAAGNFGVGAKVAAGSRNPHGLEYRSWSGPGARWFASSATPTAAGGSSPSTGPTDAQTSGARSASRRSVAIARPGSRHPGRAARPAQAPRHHPGPRQCHRRPPAMDHPLPQRPLRATPRTYSCACTTAADSHGSYSASTARSTTSSIARLRPEPCTSATRSPTGGCSMTTIARDGAKPAIWASVGHAAAVYVKDLTTPCRGPEAATGAFTTSEDRRGFNDCKSTVEAPGGSGCKNARRSIRGLGWP